MDRRDLREFYLIALSGNSTALPTPPHVTESEKPQIANHDTHKYNDSQQDPQGHIGYTALGSGNDDADPLESGHHLSPLGRQWNPNNSQQHVVPEEDNTDSEQDLASARDRAVQLRSLVRDELSILRNLQSAWKDSACQRCRLLGLGCDRAKPSCWICQHNFLQCHYKHDEATIAQEQEYQSVEPEFEPTSWPSSLRDNPYHSLGGKQKKHRPQTRLPKPRPLALNPRQKSVRFRTEDIAKDEEEPLLRIPSPATFEDGEYLAEAETTRTPSPTPQRASPHPPSANPSHSSGHTISLVFAPSLPTTPEGAITRHTSWGSGSQTLCDERGSGAKTDLSTRLGKLGSAIPSDSSPIFFQCTFCLKRCKDEEEWEQHEYSQHIPQEEWICMPWGPIEESGGHDICVFCDAIDIDIEHCSAHADQPCYGQETKDRTFISKGEFQKHLRTVHNQQAMTRAMQDWSWPPEDSAWYWNCGFCSEVLARWSDRAKHIGSHFQGGEPMSSWDPLMPSYPLDKTTLACVAGFPPLDWDAETLLTLQREQCDQAQRAQMVTEQVRVSCQPCGIFFRSNTDAERHKKVWHLSHEVWLCPTTDDVKSGPLASYFSPTAPPAEESDTIACPYCNVLFTDLAQLYPGISDWDARAKHLETDHNFNTCQPGCKFSRSGDVLLHLTNIHNISLSDYTKEVLDSCKKEERLLAGVDDCPSPAVVGKPDGSGNTD
ncbi:MAG: hypothetical protein M1840_005874 [Geoglossum simile]|nr:MAG: hypothetical protein M1840_005874 [Geoglossum simile]